MKYLQVQSIGICPFIWNSLPLEAIVENGSVTLNNQVFTFKDGDAYPDGTKVLVQKMRDIYCQSLAEIEMERTDREKRRIEAQETFRKKEVERVSRVQAFNDSLNIPVKWTPEIKHVLSGLSEGSNGDGSRRNSKTHVYLREPLEGRLKRAANSFLCKPSQGRHFNELIKDNWTDRVSCPQCLKIAERWSK